MQAEKGRARDSSRSSSVRTEGPRAGPGGPEKNSPNPGRGGARGGVGGAGTEPTPPGPWPRRRSACLVPSRHPDPLSPTTTTTHPTSATPRTYRLYSSSLTAYLGIPPSHASSAARAPQDAITRPLARGSAAAALVRASLPQTRALTGPNLASGRNFVSYRIAALLRNFADSINRKPLTLTQASWPGRDRATGAAEARALQALRTLAALKDPPPFPRPRPCWRCARPGEPSPQGEWRGGGRVTSPVCANRGPRRPRRPFQALRKGLAPFDHTRLEGAQGLPAASSAAPRFESRAGPANWRRARRRRAD